MIRTDVPSKSTSRDERATRLRTNAHAPAAAAAPKACLVFMGFAPRGKVDGSTLYTFRNAGDHIGFATRLPALGPHSLSCARASMVAPLSFGKSRAREVS